VHTIKLTVGGVELTGALDDSDVSVRIMRQLPLEALGESWGMEVYFPVRVHSGQKAPVTEVKVGDIAFWPDGPDLCLFFGPTPKSTGETPIPAHPVTVVGSFQFNPADFDLVERRRHGIAIRVEPGQ
jgi:hypothetical protein